MTFTDKVQITVGSCKKHKWTVLLLCLGAASYLVGSRVDDLPMPVDKWGMLGFFAGAVQLWVDMQKKKGVEEVSQHVGSLTSSAISELKDDFQQHRQEVNTQHESLRQTLRLLIDNGRADNTRHERHEKRLAKLEEGQSEMMVKVQKIVDKIGA